LQKEQLKDESNRTLTRDSDGSYILRFESFSSIDAGSYECIAENEAGEAKCSLTLKAKTTGVHFYLVC